MLYKKCELLRSRHSSKRQIKLLITAEHRDRCYYCTAAHVPLACRAACWSLLSTVIAAITVLPLMFLLHAERPATFTSRFSCLQNGPQPLPHVSLVCRAPHNLYLMLLLFAERPTTFTSRFSCLQSAPQPCTYVSLACRAARNLHDRTLESVLGSSMSFFDRHPVGRILNRLTIQNFKVTIHSLLAKNNNQEFPIGLLQ